MVSFIIKWRPSSDSDVVTRSTALAARLFHKIESVFPKTTLSEDIFYSHIDGAASSATRLEIKEVLNIKYPNELGISEEQFLDYIAAWLKDFGEENKERIEFISCEVKGDSLPDVETTIWENH